MCSWRTRVIRPGLIKWAAVVAAGMSLFQLASTQVLLFSHIPALNVHLAFALTVVFLNRMERRRDRALLLGLCVLATLLATGYIHWNEAALVDREGAPTRLDTLVGITIIILVIAAGVLSFGWLLPGLCMFSLVYAYLGPYFPGALQHGGIGPIRLVGALTTFLSGIYGTLLFVSMTYIAIFVIFGAFLEHSGAARFFIDMPLALFRGKKAGGGYSAVVSSALMGMASGSPTANVLTTGRFTIPLMKRSGFLPHIAGGIEAVASVGGQVMPPVMGAVAFIMSEFTGVPYVKIIGYALIPALIYYTVLGFNVRFRSAKMELEAVPEEELPILREVLRKGWQYVLPLVVLTGFLVVGYTPQLAAFWAIASLMVLTLRGWKWALPLVALIGILSLSAPKLAPIWVIAGVVVGIWPGGLDRDWLTRLGRSLSEGGRNAADFAAILACLSIAVKVIILTGVGLKLPQLVGEYSGGIMVLGYIITAVASTVLGMGLPSAAAYIVVAVLAVPALEDLGATILQAHFFVLYFAVLSALTPPVAMTALAGSRVAEASYTKTAIASLQFGAVAFIVPFYFVYNPALLSFGSWNQILWASALTMLSMISLSACLQGYFLEATTFLHRLLLLVATVGFGGVVMGAELWWALVGLLAILAVTGLQMTPKLKLLRSSRA